MVDETPSYYIQEGKIYKHHRANHYRSAGFICGEDARNEYLCEAIPRNINKYLLNLEIYNYDTNSWEKKYISEHKDAFDNDLFIGDHIFFIDTDYSDRFQNYCKGIICGFTKEFVKINNVQYDKTINYDADKDLIIKRMNHRVILNEI